MKKIYKKLDLKKFTKYIIISLVTTIINVAIFMICAEKVLLNEIISNCIAWVITVLITFFLNKKIVFDSNTKKRETLIELVKFYVLRISSLLIDTLVLYICLKWLLLGNLVSKIISNIGTTFNNYFISKYFIFKNKEKV